MWEQSIFTSVALSLSAARSLWEGGAGGGGGDDDPAGGKSQIEQNTVAVSNMLLRHLLLLRVLQPRRSSLRG